MNKHESPNTYQAPESELNPELKTELDSESKLETNSESDHFNESRAEAKKVGQRVINGIGNYEFPPIMSEEEARHWRMIEVPKNGLYESFDEINEHCPEQLEDAIWDLEYIHIQLDNDPDGNLDRAARVYAAAIAYMNFGELYDKDLILEGIRNEENNGLFVDGDKFCLSPLFIDKQMVKDLPEKYDPKTEATVLSSALHLVHNMNPEIRGEANESAAYIKKQLAKEKGIDLDLQKDVYLPLASGDSITGKDAFPEYLESLVEEKLAPWRDDLSVEYMVTWANSHLDNGEDYDYSISEHPYVEISSINDETLTLAESALDKITQEEVNRAYNESKKPS